MLIYLQMIEGEEERTKFSRIYDAHLPFLFAVARRILASDSDAEDAVHQSFLALIQHLDHIRDVDSPATRAYLAVTVEHKALDILRARQHTILVDDLDSLPGLDVPPPGDHGLADAMARLPAQYREALLLRFDQGYSVKEIAAILDTTPGAVRKSIWRAKQRLKEELEVEGITV